MDSSVSGKGEFWFLRVCHHVPHELYLISCGYLSRRLPCCRWGHTHTNGPNSVGRANTWLAPASSLACHFPSCAKLLHTVFTVLLAGSSLHLYWFLNRGCSVTIEFVCRNHSTIRVFCSVVSGGAILNDVTAASVAKYGKNTDVWRLRRYHLHRALYFIVYRSNKIDSNWLKHPVVLLWHCMAVISRNAFQLYNKSITNSR